MVSMRHGRSSARLVALVASAALVATLLPLAAAPAVVAAAAVKLTFATAPPVTATAGVPVNLTVQAVDGSDAVDTEFAGSVAFTSTDAAATVTPTSPYTYKASDGGSVTFSVTLKTAGSRQITFASAGLASAIATITVVAGDATKLAFTQQPSTAPSATPFTSQPRVAVLDEFGNTVTTDNTTKVRLSKSAGPAGALSCSNVNDEVIVTAGVATFSGCRITGAGIGYRLAATDTSPGGAGHPYAAATSSLFDIPDNVGFETQPGGGSGTGGRAQGGVPFTNQPKLTVRVGTANFTTSKAVNDSTTVVTLSIKPGTGAAGAKLTCQQTIGLATSLRVTSGSAQFTGCSIDKAGTSYRLVATSSPGYGVNYWESNAFDVVAGPPSRLTFIQQPSNGTAGAVLPTQPIVAITDAGGNVVTSGASATVNLSIGTNPGLPAGVLTCQSLSAPTVTSGANYGRAFFSGCKISNAGSGYTLRAIATNVAPASLVLGQATSDPFTIGPAQAAITVTPSASVITWGQTVVIRTHFATNGAGKTFQLQGTRDGLNWSVIATLTTDSLGNSVFSYRPATNLYYRAVFGGTSDLSAGTSNTARTVVRQIALLRPTGLGKTKVVRKGTAVTFTTTVRPNRPEIPAAKVTFRFYKRVSGTWRYVTKRDVYINSEGKASYRWTFSSRGEWYVRSIANPTPYNANSVWSPVERYSVR